MMLLPPAADKCPICATEHDPRLPHNRRSLYYHYRFLGTHGRWPTWADAAAHCTPEMRAIWRREMERMGHEWTEPKDGQPIADPPADSMNQATGDVNSATFGPAAEAVQPITERERRQGEGSMNTATTDPPRAAGGEDTGGAAPAPQPADITEEEAVARCMVATGCDHVSVYRRRAYLRGSLWFAEYHVVCTGAVCAECLTADKQASQVAPTLREAVGAIERGEGNGDA